MATVKTACFFSHENRPQLQREQYSIQDIRILHDLGYEVTVATSFSEIPWGCDLYFSWWASGSILPLVKARLSGKPIVVVAGGNDSMFYRDSLSGIPRGYLAAPWYKKLAARLSLRLGTVTLVVSRYMLNDVAILGARQPLVVPNSVDTGTFCPSDHNRLHVTTIFNLYNDVVSLKRGEVFLRSVPIVLETYPEQTFVVIGDKGNAYKRLHALACGLGIQGNVDFVGSMQNTDVVNWLQRSRIYVQISDTETFGMVVAEAMSCGTPVVVSPMGAIPELVGSHGVFVDHNDPRSVAAGITGLLAKTEQERHSIGVQTRARIIEHFSYEKRRVAIQRVIEDLSSLESPNGQHPDFA
ncbi:MAG TPA: glycosyltransferase family 4 protein [Candidatus Acidoferrales bacterium]|nr:glycosyltransferase family 4 protein [Candidatus Acidoferrales bacterium]